MRIRSAAAVPASVVAVCASVFAATSPTLYGNPLPDTEVPSVGLASTYDLPEDAAAYLRIIGESIPAVTVDMPESVPTVPEVSPPAVTEIPVPSDADIRAELEGILGS